MLRKAGLNVVRMNFSHGSYEYHQSVIDNAREAERKQPGRPLAIALDTVGLSSDSSEKRNIDPHNRKVPRSVLATLLGMKTSQSQRALK